MKNDIVSTGGGPMNEGFLLHVGDRMFWDNVYANLAAQDPPEMGA